MSKPLQDSHPQHNPALSLSNSQLWLLIVALSLTLASALSLHEIGNRLLTMGTVFGMVVNARALSCLANIAGVVLGFAVVACFFKQFIHAREKTLFWIAYFALQAFLATGFYLTFLPLGPCEATLVIQLVVGALQPLLLIEAISFTRWIAYRQFAFSLMAVLICTVALVYGVLSVILALFPPIVCLIAQLVLIGIAAACLLYLLTSLGPEYAAAPLLPQFTISKEHKVESKSNPLLYLVAIMLSYGLVFGFLHVIPLGLPTFQLPRVLPNLIGIAATAGLYALLMPKGEPTTTLVWDRIFRVSFPFVTLAALLIPYTSANEFVSSLMFVESAQFFFIALFITGCVVICHSIGVSYMQLTAYALLLYNVGFLCGDFIAMLVHDIVPLNDYNLGLMGITIFVLLTVVTLNSNASRYAKTAWGILPRETPQALFKKKTTQRCGELAAAYGLTAREHETLELLAQGMKPKEISERLTVSITTIRTHVQGIYHKLGVHSAEDLRKLIEERAQG